MEKRHSERKQVHIVVRFTTGGESYDAFIDNISSKGVGLNFIFTTEEVVEGILPGKKIEIQFQNSKGEEITLQCEIRWVNVSADISIGNMYLIGTEIIDPPAEYKEFLRTF